MTTIFDGKLLAKKIEQSLDPKDTPKLAAILIGKDPVSILYLNVKKKAAERIGATIEIFEFPEEVSQNEVVQSIESLNKDNSVDGIMIQLPVPTKFDKELLFRAINPQKDVDGHREDGPFLPATIAAILKIMNEANVVDTASIVVVGSSGTIGTRLVKLLRNKKYSVMEVDIETQNPLEVTRMADVIITATGKSQLVTDEWVKKQAVVIDLGAPIAEVQFNKVAPKTRFITPVPGGVGPVTVACLMENLVKASHA